MDGHQGVVKILPERGDVNHDGTDKYCQTPLPRPDWNGQMGVVEVQVLLGKISTLTDQIRVTKQYSLVLLSMAMMGWSKYYSSVATSIPTG